MMKILAFIPLILGLVPLVAGIALVANYRGFADKLARTGALLGVELKNVKLLRVVGTGWISVGAFGTLFGITFVVNKFWTG